MGAAIPPTMTLHACAEAFRANQIPMSEAVLSRGIKEGRFPFALCCAGDSDKLLIWRRQFYTWLAQQLMTDKVVEIAW